MKMQQQARAAQKYLDLVLGGDSGGVAEQLSAALDSLEPLHRIHQQRLACRSEEQCVLEALHLGSAEAKAGERLVPALAQHCRVFVVDGIERSPHLGGERHSERREPDSEARGRIDPGETLDGPAQNLVVRVGVDAELGVPVSFGSRKAEVAIGVLPGGVLRLRRAATLFLMRITALRGLPHLRRDLAGLRLVAAEEMRDALRDADRSEEHTSELQSQSNLVCRLLL